MGQLREWIGTLQRVRLTPGQRTVSLQRPNCPPCARPVLRKCEGLAIGTLSTFTDLNRYNVS
jgi:hypothetical protein